MIRSEDVRNAAIDIIIRLEGGEAYTNHPADPGGETKFGISKRYNQELDIKNLTREQATEVYANKYWVGLDKLPAPLALLVFDHKVNAGESIEMLQRLINVKVDGKLGPATILAAEQSYQRNGINSLRWYTERRIEYYRSRDTWSTFGAGFVKRSLDVLMVSVQWHLGEKMLREAGIK